MRAPSVRPLRVGSGPVRRSRRRRRPGASAPGRPLRASADVARRLGLLVGAAVAWLAGPWVLGCGPEALREPPRELLGVWRTADPRYADRFLEIAPDAVVFGVGGGHSMTHRITAVVPLGPAPEGSGRRYRIEFRDAEGGTGLLEVHQGEDAEGGFLRLAHRDAVWRPSAHRIDP